MRYVIRDVATHTAENIILWDGTSPYDPGEGKELIELNAEDNPLIDEVWPVEPTEEGEPVEEEE
jgi:hypothetical protein